MHYDFISRTKNSSQHHGSGNICVKATKQVDLNWKKKRKKLEKKKRTFPKGDSFEILFLEVLTHMFWMLWSASFICCSPVAGECEYLLGPKEKRQNFPTCALNLPVTYIVLQLKGELLPGDAVSIEKLLIIALADSILCLAFNTQKNIMRVCECVCIHCMYVYTLYTHTEIFYLHMDIQIFSQSQTCLDGVFRDTTSILLLQA